MDKVQFSPSKNNTFTVRFNALTKGEVFALINALRIARKVSAVAKDLSSYLSNGIYKVKSVEAKIMNCFDNGNKELAWRFCEEYPNDWSPFCGRFPRSGWMVWPN